MKRVGLTIQEHREIGKNLRSIKAMINSLSFTIGNKVGKTKKAVRLLNKAGKSIDGITFELRDILLGMDDLPNDAKCYYYKI